MKTRLLVRACLPPFSSRAMVSITILIVMAGGLALSSRFATAQKKEIVWSADEKPLAEQIHGLRGLADDVRAHTTKELALKIRHLPATENKLRLATGLAGLSTEGDFGRDTLQEVATTLAETLKERPVPWEKPAESSAGGGARATQTSREPAYPYIELATLVRYEHVQASVDDPQFPAAMARLEAEDEKRQHPEFTLRDISGKTWTFQSLRGKVVLVNFWATWCPPCRKEMPDLQALYDRYKDQGFVVLSISDEEAAKVSPFITERNISYPVLLDPGRKVNEAFVVEGIPKSFVYDREGKLVAQSIDMRTRSQFQQMLAQAGLN